MKFKETLLPAGAFHIEPLNDERLHGEQLMKEHGLIEPFRMKYDALFMMPNAPAQHELLQLLCDKGGMTANGCSRCPSYTFFKNNKEDFEIASAEQLNLTGSEFAEIALSLNGCEHHTSNYSGTAIFRQEGNHWRRIYYGAGIDLQDCYKIKLSNTQDAIACVSEEAAQGYATSSLFALLWDGEQVTAKEILELHDNTAACPAGEVLSEKFQNVAIEMDDENTPSIVVSSAKIYADVPEKYKDLCDAQDNGYLLPDPENSTRRFSWVNNEFKERLK